VDHGPTLNVDDRDAACPGTAAVEGREHEPAVRRHRGEVAEPTRPSDRHGRDQPQAPRFDERHRAEVLATGEARELERRLQGRRVLLVLDNFEHLLAAAPQVAALAATEPNLTILATSRVPLGVRGERRYPVEPLPLEDAVALFLERAREVNPRFGAAPPSGGSASGSIGFRSRWNWLPCALAPPRRRRSPTDWRPASRCSPAGATHRRGNGPS
jgi:hypothetical protein